VVLQRRDEIVDNDRGKVWHGKRPELLSVGLTMNPATLGARPFDDLDR
jgi:hypothetical protein